MSAHSTGRSTTPTDHYANDARESAERLRTDAKSSLEHARSVTERLGAGRHVAPAEHGRLDRQEQTLREHTEQVKVIRASLLDRGLESGYIDGVEADLLLASEAVRNAQAALGRAG